MDDGIPGTAVGSFRNSVLKCNSSVPASPSSLVHLTVNICPCFASPHGLGAVTYGEARISRGSRLSPVRAAFLCGGRRDAVAMNQGGVITAKTDTQAGLPGIFKEKNVFHCTLMGAILYYRLNKYIGMMCSSRKAISHITLHYLY